MNRPDTPVLFYDGECGLCSRSVGFLMRRDRSRLLYYAPLQGETAAGRLDASLRQSLSTVVYQRTNGDTLLRSDAILHVLIDIGSGWRLLARPALYLPRAWRDWVYDWVAARRHKFFRKGACRIPSPAESQRILN